MGRDVDDEPRGLDHFPSIVSSPGATDAILFPRISTSVESNDTLIDTDTNAEALSVTLQRYIEMGRQAFNASPRPPDLICCSLVSSGHPGDCV